MNKNILVSATVGSVNIAELLQQFYGPSTTVIPISAENVLDHTFDIAFIAARQIVSGEFPLKEFRSRMPWLKVIAFSSSREIIKELNNSDIFIDYVHPRALNTSIDSSEISDEEARMLTAYLE